MNPKSRPSVLLVNPWIHDFAAYDLWLRPLGLLYIASVLRDHQCSVELLDCLDRDYSTKSPPLYKKYYTGNYEKERIKKPESARGVNRYFSRYGIPWNVVVQRIREMKKPDVILVTSGMTYWYSGVAEIISLLKDRFPGVPVVLGGIYASLVTQHAQERSGADFIFTGEAENYLPGYLAEKLNFEFTPNKYSGLDDIPYPAFDIYRKIMYLPILTARGCPLKCTFCASHKLSGKFRQRSVGSVVDEISFSTPEYGIRDIVFYDDALLQNRKRHIQPILERLISKDLNLRLHTPNGLQADQVDRDTAELLVRAGLTTVRLSLETVAGDRRTDMNNKVSRDGFAAAVRFLSDAGMDKRKIESYILQGLPGQKPDEVIETLCFSAQQGIITKLASYSPIPGTEDWQKAVESGTISEQSDLIETNNSVYILRNRQFGENIANRIKLAAKELNACVRKGRKLPEKRSVYNSVLNDN